MFSGQPFRVHISMSSLMLQIIPHICHGTTVPRVVPVEKNPSCGEICPHVDKFSTDCHVDKFSTWQIVMWKEFSIWEMWRKNVYNSWCFVAFYAVLLQNRDLRSFVAISILSQFKPFCVEKKMQPRIAPVEKNWLIWGMLQIILKVLSRIKFSLLATNYPSVTKY